MLARRLISMAVCVLLLAVSEVTLAKEANVPVVRVGVLKFGTVNWELDVIKHHGLDKKHGIDLRVVPLGSKNATHVAIQGGAADIIVSDWIWVSRQRAGKHAYTFVPYSQAAGALMVSPDSGIETLADLQGKKLGVAGGPVDKTWLLLRAHSRKNLGSDLADLIEPSFAAPPLLNELALRGDLHAALNFWHYTARLQASGFKRLVDVPELLKSLGVERPIPVIGWVFNEQWAENHTQTVKAFLRASRDAKALLLESDEEWERLKPRMKAKTDAMFITLRDAFREGIPGCFGKAEKQAAAVTFAILADLGGKKLVGDATELDPGTFWEQDEHKGCAASTRNKR